jgi:hypothetical protein
LRQDAGPIAGLPLGIDGAAVHQVDDRLQGAGQDGVRGAPEAVGDEAGAAGVVLERGVVEGRLMGPLVAHPVTPFCMLQKPYR